MELQGNFVSCCQETERGEGSKNLKIGLDRLNFVLLPVVATVKRLNAIRSRTFDELNFRSFRVVACDCDIEQIHLGSLWQETFEISEFYGRHSQAAQMGLPLGSSGLRFPRVRSYTSRILEIYRWPRLPCRLLSWSFTIALFHGPIFGQTSNMNTSDFTQSEFRIH